jgi:hypothetical protein
VRLWGVSYYGSRRRYVSHYYDVERPNYDVERPSLSNGVDNAENASLGCPKDTPQKTRKPAPGLPH